MYRFSTTVHALPQTAASSQQQTLRGETFATRCCDPAIVGATSLTCTFEDAYERLESLERMYCEPDGSFVWTGEFNNTRWQVDGNLYDRDGRLLYVELKGFCPASEFDRLLSTWGWPKTHMVFQLIREAAWLDETEFRRYAQLAE